MTSTIEMAAGDPSHSTLPRRHSFKPTPLRWPFLLAQIVLLVVAICGIILVQKVMPNSDNSASIDGHHMRRTEEVDDRDRGLRLVRRQEGSVSSGSGFRPGQPPTKPMSSLSTLNTTIDVGSESTTSSPITAGFVVKGGGFRPGQAPPVHATLNALPHVTTGGGLGTPVSSGTGSTGDFVVKGGGFRPGQSPPILKPTPHEHIDITEADAEFTSSRSSSSTLEFVVKGGGFRPGLPIAKPTTQAVRIGDVGVLNPTVNTEDPKDHTATTVSFGGGTLVGVIKGGGGKPGMVATVTPVTTTTSITFGAIQTVGGGFRPPTLPKATAPTAPKLSDEISGLAVSDWDAFASIPSGTPTTDPVVRWSSFYVELGTEPTTIANPLPRPVFAEADDDLFAFSGPGPETHVVVTSLGATPTTIVTTPEPQTIVSKVEGSVLTTTSTPPLQTIATVISGVTTTSVLTPPPQIIVSSIKGSMATVVRTQQPETFVTTVGGTLVTLTAVITPGKAVAGTVVSVIGGLRITTAPPPITITTTMANGEVITRISTPTPYVTTTGGITTTTTRLTIPTGVVTTAIVATVGGKLTTVSMTLTPSTAPTESPGHPVDPGDPADPSSTRVIPGTTEAQYFAAAFLPTLLAVVLALPLSIIDLNAKLYQPFRALARPGGASGPDSLTLRFGGIYTVLTPVRQLQQGHAVPFVTTLLVWLSWLLAPLAAEAIGVKVHGTCSHLSISGCAIAVGVSPEPARALIAVMAIMVGLLVLLAVLLYNWDTGVHHNPWSLAAIALLAQDCRLREPLIQTNEPRESNLEALFRHGHFRLLTQSSSFMDLVKDEKEVVAIRHNDHHEITPRIVPIWPEETTPAAENFIPLSPTTTTTITTTQPNKPHHIPFLALTYPSRIFFLFFLLALVVTLTYYHFLHEDNAFELFMDSQTFGVKFLFAALGTVITFFWASFSQSVATISLFHRMAASPSSLPTLSSSRTETESGLSPSKSILLSRPTNSFSSAWAAVSQTQISSSSCSQAREKGDWLLLLSAIMAVLAELLPVVLANIPYSLTQTLTTHNVCTYISLGILGSMVAVLGGSLFVRWPHMPVDPRTLAGAIYYVADSELLLNDVAEAAGQTTATQGTLAEMEQRLIKMDRRYYYGRVLGSNGKSRMVVDAVG